MSGLYFDHVPDEIIFIILSKLDFHALNNMINMYPNLATYHLHFKILIKNNFPQLFYAFDDVYNDIDNLPQAVAQGKDKRPTWFQVYKELILIKLFCNKNNELNDALQEGNDMLLNSHDNVLYLFLHTLIKLHYPMIYDKCIPDFDSIYLLSFYNNLHKIDKLCKITKYIKNGKFDKNEIIEYSDVMYYPETLVYMLILDKDVNFLTQKDYLNSIIHVIGYFSQFKYTVNDKLMCNLFKNLGKNELIRILNMKKILSTSNYNRFFSHVKNFLDNIENLST